MTYDWDEGEEKRRRAKKPEGIRTGKPAEYQGGRTYPVDPEAAARLKRLMEEERKQREAKAKAAAGKATRPTRDIIGDLQRRAKEVNEMRRKEFTPEQLEAAYQRFLELKSMEKVAPEFGTTATTLSMNLQQAGYELSNRWFDVTPEELKALYRRYVKGEKTPALAAEAGVTESTLGRHFRRAGYFYPLSKQDRRSMAEEWAAREASGEAAGAVGEEQASESAAEVMALFANALIPEVPVSALTAREEASSTTAAEAAGRALGEMVEDVVTTGKKGGPGAQDKGGHFGPPLNGRNGGRVSVGEGEQERFILDAVPVDWPLGLQRAAYLFSKRNGNGAVATPLTVAADYTDEADEEGERRPPDVNGFIETLLRFREELVAAGFGLRGTLVIGGPIAITLEF